MDIELFYETLKEENVVGLITKAEIEATGATIGSLDSAAFRKICIFRKRLNSPIVFMRNGITTGKHRSPGHPLGKAYDIAVPRRKPYDVLRNAIDSGLLKIGIYWNGVAHSYHVEDAACAIWGGKKDKNNPLNWEYHSIISDLTL